MTSSREQLTEYLEQGFIPTDKLESALFISGIYPNKKSWLTFIDKLFLWLGSLAIACSVIFFIAYNWTEIGKYTKFGMVELLIVSAVAIYFKYYKNNNIAKVSLLVASIFLGVLLALYGQTYQTGADPWQLFFNWAMFMLPWTIIARFSALWIFWLVLINTSIVLYYTHLGSPFEFLRQTEEELMLCLLFVNALSLCVWEYLSKYFSWLNQRWAPRILFLVSCYIITFFAISSIINPKHTSAWYFFLWISFIIVSYFIYRNKIKDLFMLAMIALSGISIIISFIAKNLLDNVEAGGLFVVALFIIGLGSGAALWLKNIHKEWN